jgi:polyisoprenoid-binding protein YceI
MRTIIAATALLLSCSLTARAETYEFDKLHTQILFYVDHFGFSKSQGEFLEFEGQFDFDRKEIENSGVRITIYTESIDMDDDKWNRKMKGKTWFNTEAHPTIEFKSHSVQDLGDNKLIVHGNLAILGSTRPIMLEMKLNKVGLNIASGKKTAGFSGGAVLRRSDFGMDSHLKYIGDEVEVRLEVEGAVRPFRKNDS